MLGSVSATSGMMFMEDSVRSASVARERGIDVGLHLNFTTPFSGPAVPQAVNAHQARLRRYLRRYRLAQVIFHPGLIQSFDYVVKAQLEEYSRLFGNGPDRIDGHHHMHLCANVVMQELLPTGTLVRRNFSFQRGEKGTINRIYRQFVDGRLGRHHRMVDYLFALPPLDPQERLARIFGLARTHIVELETHPVEPTEHRFLTGGEMFRRLGELRVASRFPAPHESN